MKGNPKVLVLNKAYMPIDVISWEEAIGPWYTDRAKIVHTYSGDEYVIRSGRNAEGFTTTMMCPSVIVYMDAPVNTKNMVLTKPLSRRTLYDEYKGICCYCGRHMKFSEYTREHVVPQSRGGLDVWDNVAPCCSPCNSKKDNKTLKEARMKLQYPIGTPKYDTRIPKNLAALIGPSIPHESWRQYMYWNKPEL